MDNYSQDYGRKGATQLLRDAHKQDILSVIEIAPTNGTSDLDDYLETIGQADYLILNDRLMEDMLSVELYTDGHFDPELARDAAQKLIAHGLRKAVVIYARSSAFYLSADGTMVEQAGRGLPASQRIGSAGIDHAFAAGFFRRALSEKAIKICLKQGLAVAVACRTDLSPSDGIGL